MKVRAAKQVAGAALDLTDPTIVFGTAPVFVGSMLGMPVPVGTLDLGAATTRVRGRRLRIRGIAVELTDTAAAAMNAMFLPAGAGPGFQQGDAVETGTLSLRLKR